MLYPDIAIPNSICFSPDGATAYFTDTPAGLLLQRSTAIRSTGLPQGEPQSFSTARQEGWIDGSVVDADGVLWNARWGGGSRRRLWSPDGRRLRSIAVPARQSSCPAFVGPMRSRLVVTSAWKGMDAAGAQRRPAGRQDLPARLAVRGRSSRRF